MLVGPQHPAKDLGQPEQRAYGFGRGGLHQIADRGEGVEEKVRIDLRAKRLQPGLSLTPADFLLAETASQPFAFQSNGVQPAAQHVADMFEQAHLVGEQSSSAGKVGDFQGIAWRLGRRDDHGRTETTGIDRDKLAASGGAALGVDFVPIARERR